jgi:RNA polymerase sigma factor (sigma-70 family)
MPSKRGRLAPACWSRDKNSLRWSLTLRVTTSSSSKLVLIPGGQPSSLAPSAEHVGGLDAALAAHLASLYRTARLLSGSETAAEDIVQETALRAFRSWDRLRSKSAVKAWLLQILHRTFLNQRRDASRRPQPADIELDTLLSSPLLSMEPTWTPVEGAVDDEVAAALDGLPCSFREAVWLVDVEELTFAEAARVLDIPPGTVASRVHRARMLLREQLKHLRTERRR